MKSIQQQTTTTDLLWIKYLEQSIPFSVTEIGRIQQQLYLNPLQPRSDIPDLSHFNYCTITYDVFHSLSSHTFSRSPPIVRSS